MTTTDNLIELDYTNNPFDLYDKTIWDIKNNEKKQLIEYIDNVISTKFEKKITEQNDIITKLKEENKTIKETLNNLLFDLARHNVFGLRECYGLKKYHNNIISANQLIELDYIDYDFVSVELKKFYSSSNITEGGRSSGMVDKDVSNIKNFVKKLYLNFNDISNIDFTDKILQTSGPAILPFYFQKFIKTLNMRRERFQYDDLNRLIIRITDSNEEKDIIKNYPDIKLNFIPNVKFVKCNWQ